MNSKFKVIHVSYSKKVPSGVLNQLKSEIKKVDEVGLPWDTVLFTSSKVEEGFINNINPKYPAPLQWLIVYYWIYRNQDKYDLILLRNIKSDLIGWLFLPFINNLVTVHHTKEIEECRLATPAWYGTLLSFIEKVLGGFKLNYVRGIAGVTNEIVNYELNRIKNDKLCLVIPNGLDTDVFDILDKRKRELKQALFIASRFEPWHGLEKLLENLKLNSDPNFVLHLVGKLSAPQKQLIEIIRNENRIICHDYLSKESIIKLMAKVDVGLSSFSMELNSLTEASTLKVREYLNNGLPVYSGHRDSGFPDNFRYYRVGEPNLEKLIKFIDEMKKITKEEVRRESIKHIDKGEILKTTYQELKRTFS